jgi:hypothetical protein
MRKIYANNKRGAITVADAEFERVMRRGPGFYGVVTDQKTGKQWEIYGANCSIESCWCAVKVFPFVARTQGVAR